MKEAKLGVFSLWTKIPMFRLQRGPLLIHTLAVSQAARVFDETRFITDDHGQELAAILGWDFGRVETHLEDFTAPGLKHIWALGKIHACSLVDESFVHLDGDVILLKPLPQRVTRASLIAQSMDFWHYYEGSDMDTAYTVSESPRHLPKFNAGLLGGADVSLVKEWVAFAKELALKFKDHPLNGTTTSMMIEQNSLGWFAEERGIQIGTLIARPDDQRGAEMAGYTHLHGSSKHDSSWIERAELRLARDFPDTYWRMLEGFKHLGLETPLVSHQL